MASIRHVERAGSAQYPTRKEKSENSVDSTSTFDTMPCVNETFHTEGFSKGYYPDVLIAPGKNQPPKQVIPDSNDDIRQIRKESSSRKGCSRINNDALIEASNRNVLILNERESQKFHFAAIICLVILMSLLLRKCWFLPSLFFVLVLTRILKLLLSWFLFVAEAKEVREFKGLAKWWINFGLKFATKTIQGDAVHTVMTAFSVNFWKGIGINYTLNIYQAIAKDGREKILRQAKETLSRNNFMTLKRINASEKSRST